MADILFPAFIIDILVIAVSFIFLNYASNTVITYALKVSAITRLGKTSIGFTLISMTTTLPELTVAIIAATTGGAPLSIGNVLGSNIFNITVILGIAAVTLGLTKVATKNRKNSSTNIIPSLAKTEINSIEFGLFVSSIIPLLLIYVSTEAAWVVGLILLTVFIIYMYKLSKVRMQDEEEVTKQDKTKLKRYILFTILGALGVVISANLRKLPRRFRY